MSSRTSWIVLLLGALALVGVVILIIGDISGNAAIPDQPDAISDAPPTVAANAAASRPGSGERAITPRRTAEPEPARTVEIEVARASGAPIADVPVVVFRDEAILLFAKTDRAGLVRLAASTGEAHAVAAVPGYRLIETRVSMEDERTRLVVPDGLEISGTVQVDGHAPRGTIKLRLWRRDEPESFDVPLPSAVRSILDYRYANANWLAVTDDTGSFRFTGLPAAFRGGIDLDLPYHVKDVRWRGEKVVELRAPAKDVVVEAGRYFEISGRVVDAADHAPVADAQVMAGWKTAVSMTTGGGQPTEKDGRFKITVQAQAVTSITLTASAGPGTEPTEIEVSDRLDEDHDVGDIAIHQGRIVTLLVHDEAGKPIAGARAVPSRGSRRDCSEPTDSEGRTTLRLTHEATTIQVAALGYEVAKIDVPAELSGSLDVTLTGDTLLTVRIVRGAAPAPGMLVKVKKTRRRFLPGSSIAIGGPDEPLIAAGMSTPVSWLVMDSADRFEAGADGVVKLAGFPPDAPIHIEVTDASGAPQFSEDVKLKKGERREVVVTISEGPRTLAGLVTDEAARPVRDARVVVAHDPGDLQKEGYRWGESHSAKTDRDGRFMIKNFCVAKTNVLVSKVGFATLIQNDVSIPTDESATKFVLAPVAPVRVHVTDSSGAPIEGYLDVTGSMAGTPIGSPVLEGSDFVFRDCGAGLLEVSVKRANGKWSTRIDTSMDHEGRITIPALGRAHVTWAKDLEDGSQLFVNLIPNDAALDRVDHRVKSGEKEIAFEALVSGTYTASIEVDPRKLKDPASRKPLAEARVEIVGGQTAEVVFKRP